MKAFAELAGRAVVRGSVCLPRTGRWHARLELDADTSPSGGVTLAFADAAVTLVGAVARGYAAHGRASVLVVGGTDGLGKHVASKAYRSVPVRVPLGDLLTECGERLSPTSTPAITGLDLARWTRFAGPACDALGSLVDAAKAVWRLLPDGSIWCGTETWPETSAKAEVIDEVPSEGVLIVACEVPALYPGETFAGKQLSAVEHTITSDRIRTIVWHG